MAKGDPSGLYVPEPYFGSGEPDLVAYLARELQRVSTALELGTVREAEFLNVEPEKPREGMIAGADGTNWNPGGGKGVYAYYSGAWNKLG